MKKSAKQHRFYRSIISSRSLSILVLIICLLSAMIPFSDFDCDGNIDSFVTEGMILGAIFGLLSGFVWLWIKPFSTPCSALQAFSSLTLPPPIQNR